MLKVCTWVCRISEFFLSRHPVPNLIIETWQYIAGQEDHWEGEDIICLVIGGNI